MTFHPVARLADIAEGSAARFEVEGVDVCVVRVGGDVHAIDDTCSHAEVSLSEGEVTDFFVECSAHGSRFDLLTGAPVEPPATEPVAVFAARVESVGGVQTVLVSIDPKDRRGAGDRRSASDDSAPEAAEVDGPDYPTDGSRL